jgi:hypothetical protein
MKKIAILILAAAAATAGCVRTSPNAYDLTNTSRDYPSAVVYPDRTTSPPSVVVEPNSGNVYYPYGPYSPPR